jgi:hypothetical protein
LFILCYAHDFKMTLFWFLFIKDDEDNRKKSRDVFILFYAKSRYFFISHIFEWPKRCSILFEWKFYTSERITNWYIFKQCNTSWGLHKLSTTQILCKYPNFQLKIWEFFFNAQKYAENQICLIYVKTYIQPKRHLGRHPFL